MLDKDRRFSVLLSTLINIDGNKIDMTSHYGGGSKHCSINTASQCLPSVAWQSNKKTR